MSKTLLVVEDDEMLQNLMVIYFQKAGFHVVTASTGEEAIEVFEREAPCFVILDLMLPKMSGEEICKYIRETKASDVPIIMVTAKINEKERIQGLKMGADDYVTKPFSPEELVLRVETILRRAGHYCQKVHRGNLTLLPNRHEIWLDSKELSLTYSEFAILKAFMLHPGHVFTREQLIEILDPYNEKDIFDRTIDVHIKNIREKTKQDDTSPTKIQTVRGVGYKFVSK